MLVFVGSRGRARENQILAARSGRQGPGSCAIIWRKISWMNAQNRVASIVEGEDVVGGGGLLWPLAEIPVSVKLVQQPARSIALL